MAAGRRVVVTGMGAVSSLGTGLPEVSASLRSGRSGVTFVPDWHERRLGSQIAGLPEAEPACPILNRRVEKTSSSVALMAIRASWEALTTAQLSADEVKGTDLAVLIGSGTGSSFRSYETCLAAEQEAQRIAALGADGEGAIATRRLRPYSVTQVMGSTAAANVAVLLGVRGESYAISSACSTGAHAIGLATLLIRSGRYDRVLAGASDEIDWTRACAFDAMHALSRAFNERPEAASRPFDRDRDGFVISGGAGVVLLESLDAARARGAPIHAELLGYAATSDGHDMVAPLTDGAIRTILRALNDGGIAPDEVDYVNAHGTSTPHGDPSEAAAMREVFGERQPWISSTKSTSGHAIGAAGSLEVIYTVLMMREGYLAPNRNLENVDERCSHLRLVRETGNHLEARTAISNSFGFGGTNACVVLRRWES